MDKYIVLLALSYFKQKGENYEINELMQILGLNSNQTDSLIMQLKNEGCIEYVDYSLKITEKGIRTLIASNAMYYQLNETEYDFDHIDKSKVIRIDEPYVPSDFLRKYRR